MRGSSLIYVGWTGHHNLGDEAIADALITRLPFVEPVHLPQDRQGLIDYVQRRGGQGADNRRVLLGGGTIIGRRPWRQLLSAAGELVARGRPWFLVGVGVEDPVFQGRNSFSDANELAQWTELCDQFDAVTVRGPRSVELLASIGVSAEVVGDPALLHEPAAGPDVDDRLIGVNLGFGSDLWGHDHGRVVEAAAGLIRELVRHGGWRVRMVVVSPDDAEAAHECLRRAGVADGRAELWPVSTAAQFFAAVRRCTVLVAERLHALVLGAAAGVPIVGLEYQPKCADFLGSVGAHDRGIRTDVVTSGLLRDHVDDLTAQREAESVRLLTAVGELRARLEAGISRIVDQLAVR